MVETFLEDLMRSDPTALLNVVQPTEQHKALIGDIEVRRERLQALHEAFSTREREAQTQAQNSVPPAINRTNPMYSQIVQSIKLGLLANDKAELDALEAEIADMTALQATLAPADQIRTLEERLAHWETLGIREKNGLLKIFFREIRVVGTPPDECLELHPWVLAVSRKPLTVPKKNQQRSGRARTLNFRRLPSAQEWMREAVLLRQA
jgi:hypothetical protein